MTLNEIYADFHATKGWEERYRLLIQLSRNLAKPTAQQLEQWQEISGCESRLWFEFILEPRQIYAYSEARLMQGLLVIVQIALAEKSHQELQQFDIQALFDELKIARHLTASRLNGLKQLEKKVKATVM